MPLRFQLAEAFVKLTLDDKGFNAQLAQVKRKLSSLGGRVVGSALGMSTPGGLIRNLTGAAGIGALVAASAKAAASAQEMEQRFNQVFRELAPEAKNFAVNFADSLDRSFHDVMHSMASFQLEFTSQGMGREAAFGMSQSLVKLTADLAAFHNMEQQDVGGRIFRAMVGNHRALYELGIVLNQAALEQQALNMGWNEGFKALDPLAKMQVRYAYIMKASSDAHGQALREINNLASQWEQLKSGVHELAIEIGTVLTPALLAGTKHAKELVAELRALGGGGDPMKSNQGGPSPNSMVGWAGTMGAGIDILTAGLMSGGDPAKAAEMAKIMQDDRWKKTHVGAVSPDQLARQRAERDKRRGFDAEGNKIDVFGFAKMMGGLGRVAKAAGGSRAAAWANNLENIIEAPGRVIAKERGRQLGKSFMLEKQAREDAFKGSQFMDPAAYARALQTSTIDRQLELEKEALKQAEKTNEWLEKIKDALSKQLGFAVVSPDIG